MLHRCSHTLPWSSLRLPRPSDLPDVFSEDILMLIPVTPYKIYASWNVSYKTQNELESELGEEIFNSSRLVIHIESFPASESILTYDVSGPNRSRYLELNGPLDESKLSLHLHGKLGYLLQNKELYTITESSKFLMPSSHVPKVIRELPPLLAKAYDPTDDQTSPYCRMNTMKLARAFDSHLGRWESPEGNFL